MHVVTTENHNITMVPKFFSPEDIWEGKSAVEENTTGKWSHASRNSPKMKFKE